jgi:hypothetical protein
MSLFLMPLPVNPKLLREKQQKTPLILIITITTNITREIQRKS